MFNQEKLKEVIVLLRGLGNGTVEPKLSEAGICNNVLYHLDVIHDFLDLPEIFKKAVGLWEEFSGSTLYPVPHDELPPHIAYNSITFCWKYSETSTSADRKYIDSRKRLCIWFADYLEDCYLRG